MLTTLLSLFGMSTGAVETSNPKAQCEELINIVLPFAEQMLLKNGEFFPFGGVLKKNGEIAFSAAYDGHEQPPSADIIKMMKAGFRLGADSGEYRATALVYDVSVVHPSTGQKSDAVAIALDHQDQYSSIVFHPYSIQNSKVVLGTAFAQKGHSDIFGSIKSNLQR